MMVINCCIMNNLVGIDFINTIRMYDLKGSTFGRKTKMSQAEIETKSNLKVLKDLNFIDLQEKLNIE